MKAKISPNMISFVTVRRGNWVLKISVYKNKQVMVVAMHCYDVEQLFVRYFTSQDAAADFIEHIVQDV